MKVFDKITIPNHIRRELLKFKVTLDDHGNHWSQDYTDDTSTLQEIEKFFIELRNSLINDEFIRSSVGIHSFRNKIPEHTDKLCKKVVLVPIKIHGKVKFSVGSRSRLLRVGEPIQFNDFLEHSIECDSNWKQVIVSIDFVR